MRSLLVSLTIFRPFLRKMNTFVQRFNNITGTTEWEIGNDNYDYHQEITRAAFADMLHDTDRNAKYEIALKMAIEKMHSMGKQANVLDIGTGTGLLSMMAVRHGADTVTACEAFVPMSNCALKIIERNGFKDKIKLIHKRSTDITVMGLRNDMEKLCNILVTEVFDTELIGEGALATFCHAHEFLLEEDCIVIPHSATVYAQIVDSPLIQNWNKPRNICDEKGNILVEVPSKMVNCAGSNSVHDLQMDQIKLKDIKFLSDPISVCTFNWYNGKDLKFQDSVAAQVHIKQSGVAQMIFMWWKLQMDTEGEVILSCAPSWGNPNGKQPWRDHWMQAIYYLPKEIPVTVDDKIKLVTSHDEYSFWFDINNEPRMEENDRIKYCTCGFHMAFARTRVAQINDNKRNESYIRLLEKNINKNSVLLVLSEGCYLSLAASKFGAQEIYYVEPNILSRKVLEEFITVNKIKNAKIFESYKSLENAGALEKINVVFGEPYFMNSILPWDGLAFVYLFKKLKFLFTKTVKVFPIYAKIMAVAVSFTDLNKIRIPLRSCQGFVMDDFDALINSSRRISDQVVEPQPLWEYPGRALSSPISVCTIHIGKHNPEKCSENAIQIPSKEYGECNGIAFWMEWVFEEDPINVISSGPVEEIKVGEYIKWDMNSRQGVYLFENQNIELIPFKFKLNINEGEISFKPM